MIVCICNNISSTAIQLAIEEAPIVPYDPFSRDYISDEEQIFQYVQETLKVGTSCGNCDLFVRQCIRDRM